MSKWFRTEKGWTWAHTCFENISKTKSDKHRSDKRFTHLGQNTKQAFFIMIDKVTNQLRCFNQSSGQKMVPNMK